MYSPHDLAMGCLYMAMQIWPPQASNVTVNLRAIVLQQQPCVIEDTGILEVYAEVVVRFEEVGGRELLVTLLGVVGEDDMVRLCPTVGACFRLIQCSHPNRADMAGSMVAGSDGGVLNRRGANEADFGVGVVIVACR